MSEISILFVCPSAVGMIFRGPGRAALFGPLMSTTLPGGGEAVKGGVPLVLTLDGPPSGWYARRDSHERGTRADPGAQDQQQDGRNLYPAGGRARLQRRPGGPPPRAPQRRRRGGPRLWRAARQGPGEEGPARRGRGRRPGGDRSAAAPTGGGKRQEPPRPRPPEEGAEPPASHGRRGPEPATPQRGPPGEPRGRADGRRRPADRPQRPRSDPKGAEGPEPGPAAPQGARGPGRERSPRRRQGRRAGPAAAQRSRGGAKAEHTAKVPPIPREAGQLGRVPPPPVEWRRAPAQTGAGPRPGEMQRLPGHRGERPRECGYSRAAGRLRGGLPDRGRRGSSPLPALPPSALLADRGRVDRFAEFTVAAMSCCPHCQPSHKSPHGVGMRIAAQRPSSGRGLRPLWLLRFGTGLPPPLAAWHRSGSGARDPTRHPGRALRVSLWRPVPCRPLCPERRSWTVSGF